MNHTTEHPSAPSRALDRQRMAERLRDAGLRATSVRVAVLEELEQTGHTTAEQVFRGVSSSLPETSLQAVYGVLSALVASGLARKVEPAGAAAHFEANRGPQHHHLVCKACGRIEDVPCAIGEAPCLTPFEAHDFEIESAEVTFWGTCSACRDTATSATSHHSHQNRSINQAEERST